MNTLRNGGCVVFVLTGMCILFPSKAAQAQQFICPYVGSMALRLQKEVEALHDEVHIHFRNSPSFKHLDHDVAEMEKLARHIQEVTRRNGTVAHMRHDVEKLDKLFHHVEDVINQMRLTSQLDRTTDRHFHYAMQRIDRTLHNLRDELAFMDRPPASGYQGHSVYRPVRRPPAGYYNIGGRPPCPYRVDYRH